MSRLFDVMFEIRRVTRLCVVNVFILLWSTSKKCFSYFGSDELICVCAALFLCEVLLINFFSFVFNHTNARFVFYVMNRISYRDVGCSLCNLCSRSFRIVFGSRSKCCRKFWGNVLTNIWNFRLALNFSFVSSLIIETEISLDGFQMWFSNWNFNPFKD